MSTERVPLAAIPELSRTASLPPPPPRRAKPNIPQPQADSRASAQTAQRPVQRHDATAATMRSVTLSLPAALVTRLKDRARTERISQPEVLMDALTSTRDRLPELLRAATSPPISDGLFVRNVARHAPAGPMATLSLRLLAPNLAAVDDLVSMHDAPSRSALCAIALESYLAENGQPDMRTDALNAANGTE